jgi:hypothetical protein
MKHDERRQRKKKADLIATSFAEGANTCESAMDL